MFDEIDDDDVEALAYEPTWSLHEIIGSIGDRATKADSQVYVFVKAELIRRGALSIN